VIVALHEKEVKQKVLERLLLPFQPFIPIGRCSVARKGAAYRFFPTIFLFTNFYLKERDLLKKFVMRICFPVLMLIVLLSVSGTIAFASASTSSLTNAHAVSPLTFKSVCGQAKVGYARCLVLIAQRGNKVGGFTPNANPTGGNAPYGPSNFHAAYNLPTTVSGTKTVAIVDAYDDPNAESDMNTYRSQYGLPSCTTANGCFKKVNESGQQGNYPSGDTGWGVEISLDLDMASAICENCHILLVEANSASFSDLGTSVNTAASLGATSISNSYGGSESSGESSTCNSYYNHANIAVTASAGDSGPGVEVPAACQNVVGVGGTTLNSNGTETAWNTSGSEGSGGGCSRYISKPSWQSSSVTGCSRKAVADVSADADPATGAYIYDTYGYSGGQEVGGTSESSPIIASVFALAGGISGSSGASVVWSHYTSGCLFKVSGKTYAYQTGLGTPNGIGCF
jgi:subtilase family serine protease